MRTGKLLGLLLLATCGPARAAVGEAGTLTQVQGDVKLFRNPARTLSAAAGSAPRALYENEYYEVAEAKVGDAVGNGVIVRTAPNGKARVVYENGDQLNVGPGTACKVSWGGRETAAEGQVARTDVNLMYGKIRGIIEKGGPRSKLQVKTRTAIMGVRGTDFFVASGGEDNGTHVTVVRGQVEVKAEPPKNAPRATEAEAVELKAGMSAEVPALTPREDAPPLAPSVELRKTTREDLIGIQKTSAINRPTAAASAEDSKRIDRLEKKAVDTALKDIQATDSKLYAELTRDPKKTADTLNGKAIDKLIAAAPSAPERHKPYKSELENLESGAYEKYFKPVP